MKNFYFFYDFGAQFGGGHKMRCVKMAEILSDIFLDSQMHFFENFENLNANFLKNADGIFIDSYTFCDVKILKNLAKNVSAKIIIFDDFGDLDSENFAHKIIKQNLQNIFILNGALNAQKLYKNINSQILCGVEFCVFSKVFKPHFYARKNLKNIFINFGASDVKNFAPQILKILPSAYNAHFVLGALNKNKAVEIIKNTPKNFRIYENLNLQKMANLMKKCDVAIVNGGGILYELALSLLPSIIIKSAQNQSFQIEQFCALDSQKSKAFLEAKNLHEIPQKLQLFQSQQARQNAKKILKKLKIGKKLKSKLECIFL